MKKYLFTLALSCCIIGVSVADTTPTPTPTATARQIAEALRLNEADYLKIRKVVSERMEEVKSGKTDVSAIDEKFTAALLQILTAEQQKAYQAFAKDHPLPQLAQKQ